MHTLSKGMAANINAEKAALAAAEIEKMGKDKSLENITEKFTSLKNNVTLLCDVVRREIGK